MQIHCILYLTASASTGWWIMKRWEMMADLNANPDSLKWLLERESPGVRYLALRDLLWDTVSQSELAQARRAAYSQGPIAQILDEMDPEGYWVDPGPGYNPKYRSTVWAIIMLAQLGAQLDQDARVATACRYVLDHALASGGRFSTTGAPSGTADCLQGNLCWALATMGCDDPRLLSAFEWTARSVTGEGVAPMGERKADPRYYAGKCGPNFACGANNKLPCAWGAVKVMAGLAAWPVNRRTALMDRAIERGVEFLFSTDPATAQYPTGYSQNPSGNWWKFGFPLFYITDLLQLVEVLVDHGYGQDIRLKSALILIDEKQDEEGRWPLEYSYAGKTWVDFGAKKEPNKWVTWRALRVLNKVA